MPLDRKFADTTPSGNVHNQDRAELWAQFRASFQTVLYVLGVMVAMVWLGLAMVLQVFTMPWKESR
jgi:hypothetical protein